MEELLKEILEELRWQRARWIALDAKLDARDAAEDERKKTLDKSMLESLAIQKIGLSVITGIPPKTTPDGDPN